MREGWAPVQSGSQPSVSASGENCRLGHAVPRLCTGAGSSVPAMRNVEMRNVAKASPRRQQSRSAQPAPPVTATPKATAPAAAPSPAKPAPAAVATPTGANQFSAEALAKARCPADTVVWVNLRSRIYHFARSKDYGKTKRGAYMCEKDTAAASFRAAKNEKHPS